MAKMKKIILFSVFLLCACEASTNQIVVEARTYPQYLKTADAFVGFSEADNRSELRQFMKLDPVRYEWCAAFVNAALHVNGVPGSESVSSYPLTARSFLSWGYKVDTPQLGDIVIFPRGNQGWQGHVGFYIRTIERDGKAYYVVLGGNQDNKVSYELYSASKALGIRRKTSVE